MFRKNVLLLAISTALLQACGGSSNSSTPAPPDPGPTGPVVTTQTGVMYTGQITGMTFTSGDSTGQLDEAGAYTYELSDGTAQTVTFSVGGVDFGNATGSDVLSLLSLSDSPSLNDQVSINKVRLLKAMASEPDSSLSLAIDENVLSQAESFGWPQPDFTDTEFETSAEVVQILGDINALLATDRTLPSTEDAQAFLQARLFCAAGGVYFGEQSGQDTGPITIGINHQDGEASALGWSDTDQVIVFIEQSEETQVEFSPQIDFSTGTALTGQQYQGVITDTMDVDGSWNNILSQNAGEFTASHLDVDFSAEYQFSAAYIALIPAFGPAPVGTYTFTLHADGSVTGTQINIAFGTTQESAITGTWTPGSITAEIEGGATLSGFIDLTTLAMGGEWADPNAAVTEGQWLGSGCQL